MIGESVRDFVIVHRMSGGGADDGRVTNGFVLRFVMVSGFRIRGSGFSEDGEWAGMTDGMKKLHGTPPVLVHRKLYTFLVGVCSRRRGFFLTTKERKGGE